MVESESVHSAICLCHSLEGIKASEQMVAVKMCICGSSRRKRKLAAAGPPATRSKTAQAARSAHVAKMEELALEIEDEFVDAETTAAGDDKDAQAPGFSALHEKQPPKLWKTLTRGGSHRLPKNKNGLNSQTFSRRRVRRTGHST